MDKQPETLLEAVRYFADEDVAREFYVHLRWPYGVACPRMGCGNADVYYIKTRKQWQCKECRKFFTAKLGTIFEDSPIGFSKWVPAMWLIANAKNGISSCEVARALGVTQKTAWFMLHRLRLAMQTPTAEKLAGPVEADETYVGGKERNKRHPAQAKSGKSKGPGSGRMIVMGVVQRNKPGKKGKVRAWLIPNTQTDTVQRRNREHVEGGNLVYTDALASYAGLKWSHEHEVINHAFEYVRGNVHTNTIEAFWSVFKRTVKGTYIAPRPWHLQRYVEEQVWRFNERESASGNVNAPGLR
jgi:transposase-like protein